jgi:hypothetical protein
MTTSSSRMAWRALLVVLTLLMVVAVADRVRPIVVGTVSGSPADWGTTHDEPGLPGRAVRILDSPHIPISAAGRVHYNSVPPTSGPHYTTVPAMGIYDEPLPAGLTVHALEHGHVGIRYADDVPASTVTALRQLGAQYPGDVFVSPCPELAHGIALTAWGRIDTFAGWDHDRIVRFVDAMSGRYDHGWKTPSGSQTAAHHG